jgi:YD repeat-containing protein
VIDTSGRELHFIGTSDYLPATVCFDADDNLWSVGREAEPTGFERADYLLVRKFSRGGKELGRYLPKSLWPAKKAQPSRIGGGYWHLRAASDRIGIAIHENHADNPAEWMEWDLAGNLLTRTLIKMDKAGRAFTSSGRLYARFRVPGAKRLELRVLDKKTGTWTAVADNLPDTPEFERAFLLGAEGDDLVYSLDFRLVLVRPGN